MYVAARGGERAISNAHAQLASRALPRPGTDRISCAQIDDQLGFLISRVMTEGSVYDRDLAARAIRQAQGDVNEAIFLVRAFRATLPRFGATDPIETRSMRALRRVSAVFKDVPGGQILGPTFDYSHRLIDFANSLGVDADSLIAASDSVSNAGPLAIEDGSASAQGDLPKVLDVLNIEGIIERVATPTHLEVVHDLTRSPLGYPAARPTRLQAMTRGDEGFLLAMGYSTQRGFGSTHPFAGEIRVGDVDVRFRPPELDFDICIGEIEITECEMINQFVGTDKTPPQFTRGYGIGYGQCERKAMAMALVDRAMRAAEFDELPDRPMPAQDIEFVLSHCDTLEASGFVQHLKLPHYVDFQSELVMLRQLRAERLATPEEQNFEEQNLQAVVATPAESETQAEAGVMV